MIAIKAFTALRCTAKLGLLTKSNEIKEINLPYSTQSTGCQSFLALIQLRGNFQDFQALNVFHPMVNKTHQTQAKIGLIIRYSHNIVAARF